MEVCATHAEMLSASLKCDAFSCHGWTEEHMSSCVWVAADRHSPPRVYVAQAFHDINNSRRQKWCGYNKWQCLCIQDFNSFLGLLPAEIQPWCLCFLVHGFCMYRAGYQYTDNQASHFAFKTTDWRVERVDASRLCHVPLLSCVRNLQWNQSAGSCLCMDDGLWQFHILPQNIGLQYREVRVMDMHLKHTWQTNQHCILPAAVICTDCLHWSS